MNEIINFYKNDGELATESNYDYAQVKLEGKHATVKIDTGNIMLVSRTDLNSVVNFKWYLNNGGYPATYGTFDGSIKYSRPVPLHRLMYGQLAEGYVVDHINRDKLDNRRENLRICTALENSYNKTKPKHSTKKYKGVTKLKNGTYIASITKDGQKYEIKNIGSEQEAASVYDHMAEELFGEYAAKNFR